MKKSEIYIRNITEEANKLFYEKGYDRTMCSEIAAGCGMSQGALFYYFKTKPAIASSVYVSYMKKLKDIVAKKYVDIYEKYDLQICTAIEYRLETELLLTDKNACDFYLQYFKSDVSNLYENIISEFYEQHNLEYALEFSPSMLKMIAIEGRVAGIALNLAYFGNELSISYDEFIRHSVSVPFKILGISKERIEEIIEESEIKFKELDFKLKPYFKFE